MNKYFVKASEVKDRGQALRPHTARALKKLEKQDGLLVDHSMGSGKTLLYLKAIEAYQKKNPTEQTLIIAPASLTSNVGKEIRKHGVDIDMSRLEILSYEKATIDADRLKKKVYGMVVADESHRLRNSATKRHKELSEIIVKAKKRVLGTGTTAYNHASDIGPLVNLAAGRRVLPEGKAEFEARYIRKSVEQPPFLKRILGHPPKEIHHLKNKGELEKILRAHIDHYDLRDDPSAKDKFPEKIETVKEVQMSPEQSALYKYMEGKLPFHLRMKVRMNMPLDKKDVASLQAFSTGIRQVSNSMNAFMPNYDKPTPKIQAAVDSLEADHKKNKKFKALVYSNFLNSGLNDYSAELTRRGISHSVYHGGLNKTQKDKILQDYNEDKTRVMLFSSSGTEGLNTKGTRKVQILEPHFNKSKISQAVARAVRYESHEHLPVRDRKVDVEHWHSVFPAKKWYMGPKNHSIDQYLHHNSNVKSEISDQMKELVKEAEASLIKQALNAFKAREMARTVGIIPDHTTQWKYGLRKLRGSDGKPLTGSILENAKVRMGALRKTDFDSIVKTQEKYPGREIGFTMDKSNKIIGEQKVGSTYEVAGVHNPTKGETTGHTHVLSLSKHPHRVTHASGLNVDLELPFKKRSVDEALKTHGVFRKIVDSKDIPDDLLPPIFKKFVRGVVGRVDSKTRQVSIGGLHSNGRDIANAILHGRGHPYNRTSKQNILSPEQGVEAVHKSTGVVHNDGTVLATKHRTVMFKRAMELAQNTYSRARYKELKNWDHVPDPVGTVKRDGGAFFMTIDSEGKPRFVSRRPSVKGGYPDRTEKLPHLASIRLPDFAGHTYHTELVHTGHDTGEFPADSHAAVSGILNSLKERAIRTQEQTGPVRAVLVDVLHPKYPTYAEKLEHLKRLAQAAGKPDVLHTPTIKIGRAEILDLIEKTKGKKQEGVIVTSLSTPEDSNVRYKIKHVDTYNLEVVDVIQEEDILGNPKESMGALLLKDASGRIVGKVGTGFSREDRIQMWKNKALMPGTRIQVKAMPPTASKLRAPVYNGYADGELDTVKEWSGQ